MSLEALAWAFAQNPGDSTRKLVLLAYADVAQRDGQAYLLTEQVAETALCAGRTAGRHITALIADGYMREGDQSLISDKIPRRFRPIVYQLAMSDEQREAWAATPVTGRRALMVAGGARGAEWTNRTKSGATEDGGAPPVAPHSSDGGAPLVAPHENPPEPDGNGHDGAPSGAPSVAPKNLRTKEPNHHHHRDDANVHELVVVEALPDHPDPAAIASQIVAALPRPIARHIHGPTLRTEATRLAALGWTPEQLAAWTREANWAGAGPALVTSRLRGIDGPPLPAPVRAPVQLTRLCPDCVASGAQEPSTIPVGAVACPECSEGHQRLDKARKGTLRAEAAAARAARVAQVAPAT